MTEKLIKLKSEHITEGSILASVSDVIKMRISLTLAEPLADSDVLRVYLASSYKDFPPIKCPLIEVAGVTGSILCVIDNLAPYDVEDIDTAFVIVKNVFTEKSSLCGTGFFKTEWDYGKYLEKYFLIENKLKKFDFTNIGDVKSPIERGKELLNDIKNMHATKSTDIDINRWYINQAKSNAQKYKAADFEPDDRFLWYKIEKNEPVCSASAFLYVLRNPMVLGAIDEHGHYLTGFFRQNENIISIAVPVAENEANPLRHVDDCCVYLRPDGKTVYSAVCIELECDGQYFVKM